MSPIDLYYLQVNLTSLLILAIIALRIQSQHPSGRLSMDLFEGMLLSNTVLVFLEMIINLTIEHPGFIPQGVIIGITTVFYAFNPAVSAIYLAFVVNWVSGKEALSKRFWVLSSTPYAVFLGMVVLSIWAGYLFKVSETGVYMRGDGFWLLVVTAYGYFGAAVVVVLRRWKLLRITERRALLVFGLLPSVGGIIQTVFYGTAVVWNMVTMALLIIYVDILSGNLESDALTGLANRRRLIPILKSYRKEFPDQVLGGIMMDINAFKVLNDTYGHKAGDEALLEVADTLTRCVYRTDQVFRLGGDEFLILAVLKTPEQLEAITEKIHDQLKYANQRLSYPFDITLSCGGNTWPMRAIPPLSELIADLDERMYARKRDHYEAHKNAA